MRVLLLLTLLLSAAVVEFPPTAHAAHAQAVQQEERLIGWLGEVPRPQLHDSAPTVTDAVVGPGGATALAGFPEHDASDLDTDFIGVGNPNVEKLSDEPKAYLYHGFLSPEEAAHLVKIGEPHLKRSTVVGGKTETGEDNGLTDDVRTSHGTFIPKEYDDIVHAVEMRVEQFSQISYENQEQLQLLRYHVGQQYKDHMDGLTSENGGKRIATVLMFLHEPESGGETSFPHGKPLPAVKLRMRGMQNQLSQCGWRDGRGLAVRPKVGDAILFFSFKKGGASDPGSMHASCPTLGGTKWTATKWIHERKFTTGVWKKPKCADENGECANWAKNGECKANPFFMLGAETPGSCIKSCCSGDAVMPDKLSGWQLEFCASCGGKWAEAK